MISSKDNIRCQTTVAEPHRVRKYFYTFLKIFFIKYTSDLINYKAIYHSKKIPEYPYISILVSGKIIKLCLSKMLTPLLQQFWLRPVKQ